MLRLSIFTLALCLIAKFAVADERPNILWLSCEDISPTLGCYGDPHARSPHIDQLARDGMKFNRAFVAAPVCAVNRSCIITGVYPIALGTHHMRSRALLVESIFCFTQYLREAGYYCTNNSKEDYNFVPPKQSWDESSGKAHWRNRLKVDQPFFAVFNFTGTHESFIRGDQPKSRRQLNRLSADQRVNPRELDVPPYLPDTPKVREDLARNYDNIAALDDWVASKLKELDDAGLTENTIVIFWSDHGIGMIRGKRWLYDSGMHVPLIVRAPTKYASVLEGVDANAMVSFVDLAPTMLKVAGLDVPDYMQGQVFLGPDRESPREYVFGSRDRMDERYDVMRSARDQRWLYIRNLMPWRTAAQHLSYAEQSPTMQEIHRLHAAGELTGEAARFMEPTRPVEELYDTVADPFQLNNLAADPAHAETVARLHSACYEWSLRYRDLGALPESSICALEQERGPRFRLFRGVVAEGLVDEISSMWNVGENTDAKRELRLESESEATRFWAVARYQVPYTVTDLARNDPSWAVRIAAAERLMVGGDDSTAVKVLLEAYTTAPSHLDRVMAAGVIDVLPSFDEHAAAIRAANEQLDQILADEKQQPYATEYVRRCIERFQQRLK